MEKLNQKRKKKQKKKKFKENEFSAYYNIN